MPTSKKPILKIIEEHFIKWVITLFLGGICAFTAFYFTTVSTLGQHSQAIDNVSKKLDAVSNVPALNANKIIGIERLIKRMETDSNELKQDFKDFQKQYNDDRKQIIEILIDIKRNQ